MEAEGCGGFYNNLDIHPTSQLVYLLLPHAGIFSRKHCPGYPDTDYPAAGGVLPIHKGRVGVPASRVV